MTSAEPTPTATRPADPGDAALVDALAVEYGVIYGYGLVSAHSQLADNDLVVDALNQHRDRRDQAITLLTDRSVSVPVAAAGYQLPVPVDNDTDAARLAVRMENDAAVAWRAVVEQATSDDDRRFAVTALTQSAVLAARWSQVLASWPITVAFPGGSET